MAKLELLSRTIYDANGVQTVWDFNFAGGYILPEHVKAYYELGSVRTQLTITPANLIGPNQLYISPAVPAGAMLTIYRDTPKNAPLVDFVDRGTVSEVALDTVAKQAVFAAAESSDSAATGSVDTAVAAAAVAQASALAAAGHAVAADASKEEAEGILASIVSTVSSAISSLYATLAAAGGAALIGFKQLFPGAVTRTVAAKLSESVSVKDFGAVGDGVTDDTDAIQLAVNAASVGCGIVTLPNGEFLITSPIDLKGRYVTLIGAGTKLTRIKSGSALDVMFDVADSTDVQVSPFSLQGFTLDGNNTTTTGVDVRYRHTFKLADLVVQNCVVNIREKDTWLGCHENVRSHVCGTAWLLEGANHSSHYDHCSAIGFSVAGFDIQSNGTALDGNDGLLFSNCDVEFGSGKGVIMGGTSATFNGCYLGEAVGGAIVTMLSGKIAINGGVFFYGSSANSFGFDLVGGRATVGNGTKINSQAALPGVADLAKGGAGKVKFIDVFTSVAAGGDQTLLGDVLDTGPSASVFCSRYGKNLSHSPFNNTTTVTTTGNSKTVTVNTVTGAPSLLYFNQALVNKSEWQDNKMAALVVVYSSNQSFQVRLAGGALGALPLKSIGVLPSTGGVVKTYVKLDFLLDAGAYNVLDFVAEPAAVGDTITIHSIYLADNAFVGSDVVGNVTNLYKC